LHALEGIITPSGLCFERHHSGIAEIDPQKHRLMINGPVDKPLVFTMDDIRRMPRTSRIWFLECAANTGMEWRGAQLNGCQFTHGMIHNVMYTGASAPGSVRNCISAMSSRLATARELRLHLDDIGFGKPADQVDVVRGKIDHHADIRHPRRKQTDARDRDGENVLARESAKFAALGYEASDSTLGTGGRRDHPLRRIGRAVQPLTASPAPPPSTVAAMILRSPRKLRPCM
jgi:hypothetical protein